jgi:hypothetical protein
MAEQHTAGQDGLTTQEAAYFESGGEHTEGLSASTPATPEAGVQTQQATQQDGATQQQQQDGTQQQADQRTVPLAALQEERAERRRLRDEVQQMRDQQAALMQRILAAQQQPQQPQEPQIPVPDYAADPVGHLRAQNEILARQMQQMAQHLAGQSQQQQQMTQQQVIQQQIQHRLAADEAAFRQQAPDYDAAAAFLQQSRAAEYRALGMLNPMEIQQALNQDVMAMVNIAQRNGTSVAEAAYNLAKARGYKAAQAPAAGAQGATQQQDAAAKLAAIAQGQQQAASLSGAGGGAIPPMSIEKLLAMSDADFAKATAGMNWQKLNAELSAR